MSRTYEAAVVGARPWVARCGSSIPAPRRVRRDSWCSRRRMPRRGRHARRGRSEWRARRWSGCGWSRRYRTSTHLVRSGRVPNIAGRAGRRARPLTTVRIPRRRGARDASRAWLDAARSSAWLLAAGVEAGSGCAFARCRAARAVRGSARSWLLAGARTKLEPETAFVASFGMVMVVHTGPGLVGLAWQWVPIDRPRTRARRVSERDADHPRGRVADRTDRERAEGVTHVGTSTSWRGSGVASNSSSASRTAMKWSSVPWTYVTGACRSATSAIGG